MSMTWIVGHWLGRDVAPNYFPQQEIYSQLRKNRVRDKNKEHSGESHVSVEKPTCKKWHIGAILMAEAIMGKFFPCKGKK